MTKNRCTKTIFDRKVLCAGTMTDYVTIQRREITGTTPNNPVGSETLTNVVDYFGYLEAIKPTQRFNGINISGNTTHLVYIPFDQSTYELDVNTLFVLDSKTRPRLYKLLSIENYGEQDEYLILYCKENGFADIEANEG